MTLLKRSNFNQENVAIFILCLASFTFYFVIFSSLNIKCVRYILPVFPAFVFFTIYSIENIMNFIDNLDLKSKVNSKFNFSNILLILFIILLLFNTFNFTSTVEIDKASLAIDDVANYLIEYDKNYQSKEIGIESGVRFYEWYFQKDIELYNNDSLKNAKYDYIISTEINNFNYHEIYRSNDLVIYEKNY